MYPEILQRNRSLFGTNFDRPAFREMEALTEKGSIGTVIVKDLSRFGRNYIEVGQYLEIRCPSLGIRFIAVQDNVDSLSNTGTELMPFSNIFNEWHAATTSKKVRDVFASKAARNLRVCCRAPYGYVRDENDKEVWHVDEPAAGIVRRIFDLALAGKGPTKIARILEAERIPTPTEYCVANGRRTSNTLPAVPCGWTGDTVKAILDNRQYTGCAVNFKFRRISYKVKKTVKTQEDEQQIVPDKQEPIIPEELWLRIHELRKNKRRYASSGRTSIFSGLVFCADCGSKLYFSASSCTEASKDHFICSKYKSGHGACSTHIIRQSVLERIVLESLSSFTSFVRSYENVFVRMLETKREKLRSIDLKRMKKAVDNNRKRVLEIDRIIERLYEDNINGKLSDERFMTMTGNFEAEQRSLRAETETLEAELAKDEQKQIDLRLLLKTVREQTTITELTPELVNTLIRRIEVHAPTKINGKRTVAVDIHYTGVGLFTVPDANELSAIIVECSGKSA